MSKRSQITPEQLCALQSAIAAYLQKHGLTAQELSDAAWFASNVVGRLLAGRRIPSKSTIQRIARAMHTNAEDLLFVPPVPEDSGAAPEDAWAEDSLALAAMQALDEEEYFPVILNNHTPYMVALSDTASVYSGFNLAQLVSWHDDAYNLQLALTLVDGTRTVIGDDRRKKVLEHLRKLER